MTKNYKMKLHIILLWISIWGTLLMLSLYLSRHVPGALMSGNLELISRYDYISFFFTPPVGIALLCPSIRLFLNQLVGVELSDKAIKIRPLITLKPVLFRWEQVEAIQLRNRVEGSDTDTRSGEYLKIIYRGRGKTRSTTIKPKTFGLTAAQVIDDLESYAPVAVADLRIDA